jgi:hypothetical protein
VNALYDKGREGIAGSIDLGADDIRVALVSAAYTPNLAAHQYVSDLGASIIARSGSFASKTLAAGVFDAADATITVAASQPQVKYLVIYKNSGSDATSQLVACIDTGTGLPFTPSSAGGDVIITWPNGTDRIFKL